MEVSLNSLAPPFYKLNSDGKQRKRLCVIPVQVTAILHVSRNRPDWQNLPATW